MRLTHCGRMIIHSVCRRLKASASLDSHWPGRDRQHGAAHELRHVRHDRQAPIRRSPSARPATARSYRRSRSSNGQQQHAVEQQHQPGRVAEELGHEPGEAAHGRKQRDLKQPKKRAEDRADRHGDDADGDVEQETDREKRRPLEERRDDRGHARRGRASAARAAIVRAAARARARADAHGRQVGDAGGALPSRNGSRTGRSVRFATITGRIPECASSAPTAPIAKTRTPTSAT